MLKRLILLFYLLIVSIFAASCGVLESSIPSANEPIAPDNASSNLVIGKGLEDAIDEVVEGMEGMEKDGRETEEGEIVEKEYMTWHQAVELLELEITDVQQPAAFLRKEELLQLLASKLNVPVRSFYHTHFYQSIEETYVPAEIFEQALAYVQNFEYAQDVPILTYHHLVKEAESAPFQGNSAVITAEVFAEQMEILADNQYQAFTLQELEQFLNKEIKLPRKSVIITFDDGYLSNLIHAYPVLKKHQYPAAIFVITSLVQDESQEYQADQIQFISWEQIKTYADVFQFECHTYDMHRQEKNKSYLIAKKTEAVQEDLSRSKEMLQASYFAYPFGEYNRRVIKSVEKLDYRLAFITKPGRVSPRSHKYKLQRFGIYPETTTEEFKQYIGL